MQRAGLPQHLGFRASFSKTEATGYLGQFVCCVGRNRVSLTLTRCGWATA
jgi:hypothetical protein